MKEIVKPNVPELFLNYLRRFRDIKYTIRFRTKYLNESRFISFLKASKAFLLPTKLIIYYPIRLSYAYLECKLGALFGYTMTDRLKQNAKIVHRRDFNPKSDKHEDLKIINPEVKINFARIYISKHHVELVFESIFGYSLAVDLLSYSGEFVKKSNENYTHDSVILSQSLTEQHIERGYVYQKLIDTSVNDNELNYV